MATPRAHAPTLAVALSDTPTAPAGRARPDRRARRGQAPSASPAAARAIAVERYTERSARTPAGFRMPADVPPNRYPARSPTGTPTARHTPPGFVTVTNNRPRRSITRTLGATP